jgi:hypothetical protein
MSLAELREFDRARILAKEAVEIAEPLDSPYNTVHATWGIGFVELFEARLVDAS